MRRYDRRSRYLRRTRRILIDWNQADTWFFDEAGRRIQLRRRLGRLEPPGRFAVVHAGALAAVETARELHRRSGADNGPIVESSVDGLLAMDALESAVGGAGAATRDEQRYAGKALAILESARAVYDETLADAEAAGQRALERLRAARPPAKQDDGHEAIVAAFAAVLEHEVEHRRALMARDREQAVESWRRVERQGRELDAALERTFA